MSRKPPNKPSVDSRNDRPAFEPIGSRDTNVSCPVCFVRYVAEPFRCESCGYRFG